MTERIAKLEERLECALPNLSTKAEYEAARTDLHKGQSEMKSWTLATSFVLVVAHFTVAAYLSNHMDAIAKGLQNAPSHPAAPIIIQLPSTHAVAMEQTPSSVAHGKQETPIRP